MHATSRDILWAQFGASIDMLEHAIRVCPDELWNDNARQPEFWYLAYHTLFFLDLYLSDATEGFAPPLTFTLDELDPSGVIPERPFTKGELLSYLAHGRSKARARIATLTAENETSQCRFGWIDLTRFESLLYNMRHVQHHVGQLNLLLRQATCAPPRWVARTASDARPQ